MRKSIVLWTVVAIGGCGDGPATEVFDAGPEPVDAQSPDASPAPPPELSELLLPSVSMLAPPFSPTRNSYQLDVSVVESHVRVQAASLDPLAEIRINGTLAASGMLSVPQLLDLGTNEIIVEVSNADGLSKEYVIVLNRGAEVVEQLEYTKASNTGDDDEFGFSLALSGDTLAVGAIYEASNARGIDGDQNNDDSFGSGAVYIFRRTDGVWAQEAYIKSSNSDENDFFGTSVALDGDVLAVGAVGEDSDASGPQGDQSSNAASNSGAVYMFRRTAGTWAQEAYIKASNTDADDQFGLALSLADNVLVASARREASNATGVNGDQSDNSADKSGAVYVFREEDGAWQQEAYLKASNSEINDRFGESLSLSGNMLAVGASTEGSSSVGVGGDQANNGALQSGSVYIFKKDKAQWSQEAYLKASNTEAGDRFGSSVSLSGEVLAVGAISESSNAMGIGGDQNDNSANSAGAVYVFRKTAATWSQEAYVKASNTARFSGFGNSVSVSDTLMAIGASQEDTPTSMARGVGPSFGGPEFREYGAVYLFRLDGSAWSQEKLIKPSSLDETDQFGTAVSLSGDTLAVGSIGEDSSATGTGGTQNDNSVGDSGAVFLYQ